MRVQHRLCGAQPLTVPRCSATVAQAEVGQVLLGGALVSVPPWQSGVGGVGRIRDALRLNSADGDAESELYGGASEVGDSASVAADARLRAKVLQVSFLDIRACLPFPLVCCDAVGRWYLCFTYCLAQCL